MTSRELQKLVQQNTLRHDKLPITYYPLPLFFIHFIITLLINYVDIKNRYIYT